MCIPSRARGGVRPAAGGSTCRREAPKHTAGDAADTQAGHIIEPVRLVGEDRSCGAQPAADGRPYALGEVPRGESGGVPGNEGIVAPHDLDLASKVVAVAGRVVLRARREASLERCNQVPPMSTDVLAPGLHTLRDGADTDVEPATLLRHVPG